MILHIIIHLLALDNWVIDLRKYEVFKDSLMAVAPNGNICLAVPNAYELLFFDSKKNMIRRHINDSDAPNGFRQIMSVGYYPEKNLFFVYDFGRKASFWNMDGDFVDAIFLKPLLYQPQIIQNGNIIFVADVMGELHSTPSLRFLSTTDNMESVLMKIKPLTQVNGYLHRVIPGPPVKLPWHDQFILARGMNYFVSCYRGKNEFNIFDVKNLKLKRTVPFAIPAVPVDSGYLKKTLKEHAKALGFVTNDLVIKEKNPFHPVPSQVLMNLEDNIFLYSKSFQGYLRHEYNVAGTILKADQVEAIPDYICNDYHYFIQSAAASYIIIRSDPNNLARP